MTRLSDQSTNNSINVGLDRAVQRQYLEDIALLKYCESTTVSGLCSPQGWRAREVDEGWLIPWGFRDAARVLSQNLVTAAGHGYILRI